MKQTLLCFIVILFFFLMLIFPDTVFDGACNGLLLWFHIVLPTLLPFMIVSALLINTPAIHIIVKITSPLLCRLFSVSSYGSFAVLCGFLCGYPMGGKITSDLYISGKISSQEAAYLLSFCNNTSPMFIISYVIHQNLNASHLVLPTLTILFLSPLLCSFLFRYVYYNRFSFQVQENFPTSNTVVPLTQLLENCIMKSFESITKIGGYIILFSILIQLATLLPLSHYIIETLVLPFLEITNGVTLLSKSTMIFKDKFIIILSLVSFGGWCSVFQTQCTVSATRLPMLPYIIEKLITALVTSLLAYFFLKFN